MSGGKKRKLEIQRKKKEKQKRKKMNTKVMDFFIKSKHQQISISKEFGLCDDPPPVKNPAYLDESDTIKWIAVVNNSKRKEITFTAIDNCIEYDFKRVDGKPDKRCDGVLTLGMNVIFVELKQRKGRKSKDWLNDGEAQLRSTIFHFSKTKDSMAFKHKYAYIANSKRPIFTRGQAGRTSSFLKDTGYVLRIQNRIEI